MDLHNNEKCEIIKTMLPIHKIIWNELTVKNKLVRQCEPAETMDGPEQVQSYREAYRWGGPTSALQLHHIKELSYLIRPGDTVVDLACGLGPLLLELAQIYPECHFIGADLSTMMLLYLEYESKARGLKNIQILREDITTLPSLKNRSVDLVISTSAFHHLPDASFVNAVFQRTAQILKSDGGYYFFDFGLLKSITTVQLMVKELSRTAPPITTHDYDLSLQASFPISTVFGFAKLELPTPVTAFKSSFVDFFYFLQSKKRALPSFGSKLFIDKTWKSLSAPIKVEHLMLRFMRSKKIF